MNSNSTTELKASLFKSRNFILLMTGQNLSAFGDWFRTIAVIGLIYEVTGRASSLSLLFICSTVPMIVVSTLCGPLIDKYSRKKIMIWTDLLRFFIGLGFVFVITLNLHLSFMYVLLAINGLGSGVFLPARSTIIPEVVNTEQLTRANSILATTFSASMLLATGLGGVITEILPLEVIFLIDAFTFLISGILISGIKITNRSAANLSKQSQSYFKSIQEGFKIIKRTPIVQSGLWILMSREFALSIINVIFSLYVLKVVSEGNIGLGLAYLASGIGQIAGGITLAKYFKKTALTIKFYKTWSTLSLVFLGVMHCLSYQQPIFLVFLAIVVLANLWYSPIEVLYSTNMMTFVKDEIRGRVFAAAISLSRTFYILGFVLIGIIGDTFSVSAIAWGVGAFLMFSGLVNSLLLSKKQIGNRNAQVSVNS